MITWHAHRDKTLFESYSTVLTESASWSFTDTAGVTHNGFSSTARTEHNDGADSYVVAKYDYFDNWAAGSEQASTTRNVQESYTYGFSASHTSSSETYRSYKTVDAGGTNPPVTYSATNSHSLSSSATAAVINYWRTTDSSTYAIAAATTQNDIITDTYFALTGSAPSGYTTTTSTHTRTAKTLGTNASVATTFYPINTSATIAAPQEYGTIVSAEAADWLWSMTAGGTAFNPTPSFLTQIAASFTKETFFNSVTSFPVDYATYGSSRVTGAFSYPGDVSTFTLGSLSAVTAAVTRTSGDMFSRDTYSTMALSNDISTTSEEHGDASYVMFAVSSTSYTTTIYSVKSHAAHILGAFSDNSTQTTLAGTTLLVSTINSLSALPEYQASSSSATNGMSNVFGKTIGSTSTNAVGVAYAQLLGGYTYGGDVSPVAAMTRFAPVAAVGAFIQPGELANGGHPMSFRTNLSFGGGRIQAPALSSVFANVETPVFRTASATQSTAGATFTWDYSQSGNNLSYTKQSTYTSAIGTATRTVTDSTSSEGTFNGMGSASTYVGDGGSVLGGYQNISTAAESVYFLRAGVVGTHNNTDGGSSTYRTIRTAETSDEKSGDVFIEREMLAVVTWGGVGNLSHPIFVFNRYDGGEQG